MFRFLIIVLLFATFAGADSGITIYDWRDFHTTDWPYRYLEYLLVSNPTAAPVHLSAMPLYGDEVDAYLAARRTFNAREEGYVGRLHKILPDATGVPARMLTYGDDGVALSAGGYLHARGAGGKNAEGNLTGGYGEVGILLDVDLGDRFTVRERWEVNRPFGDTMGPLRPEEQVDENGESPYVDWGEMEGRIIEAYISADLEYLTVEFGRNKVRWGPGYLSAMTVSDNPPPFDMLRITTDIGPVRASCFTALLEPKTFTWLSAHRLDWRVYDRLYVGISESILYAEQGIQPKYINPLTIYYVMQWNSRDQDNIFLSADARFIPRDGYEFYGEISIDDYQYQSYPAGAPNKVGYLAGIYTADLFADGLDLRLEYSRINRWVYTHKYPRNVYVCYGGVIGSWLGPDADYSYARLSYQLAPAAEIFLEAMVERHGDGTLYDPWEDEREWGKGIPFPFGIVEQRRELALGAEMIRPWRGIDIYAEVRFDQYKNLNHVEGAGENVYYGGLDIRYSL